MFPSSVFTIIVQYNNSQDTLRCLESVKEQTYPNNRIVVVDNASDEADINNIRKYIKSQPQIIFLENKQNLGYAGGNNIGIKQALAGGAEYILILNPDTIVQPELLTTMCAKAISDGNIGIVGCSVAEGNKTIDWGKITWLTPELKHIESSNTFRQNPKLKIKNLHYYIPGACMLISRAVFEKIGFLDESYFLYFEDADFCVRARNAGFAMAIVSEALIKHSGSATTSRLGSTLLLRYHFRNALLFNYRHAPPEIKILLPFWSFWIILKQLVKIIFLPEKRVTALAILAGVVDFHLDNFGKINL